MFGDTFSVWLQIVVSVVMFFDLFDLLLRAYLRHVQTLPGEDGRGAPTSVPLDVGEFTPYQMRLHLRPYAILLSVHNIGAGLDSILEGLRQHRTNLWIVDDASTDDTWERLQLAGVKCVRSDVNRRKPAALKELLAILPPEIATVFVLDPDVRVINRSDPALSDLERAIFEFQRSGMAAFSPHISVRRDGFLARLQSFEYSIACSLGRKGMADYSVTSGAAIYRRDALYRALDTHSLSVYAEDLENTLILLAQGERIYYDGRLVIETEAKRTWRSWFSQRVGWYFGLLRVYSDRAKEVRCIGRRRLALFYNYIIYVGVLGILLQPLKVLALAMLCASAVNGLDNMTGANLVPDSIFTHPGYFLLTYAKCTVLCICALWLGVTRSDRRYLLPAVLVYFFYALIHIIPITVGYVNWFAVKFAGRRIYKDHYQDEASLCRNWGRGSETLR